MFLKKQEMGLALAAVLFVGALACNPVSVFIAQATVTPTRTPRPTFTPLPKATDTPAPTATALPLPTTAPTSKSPTLKPATPRPPTATRAVQPTTAPQPIVSAFEFHATVIECTHSGLTFLKGTVYNDKNDPNNRYAGAIVALGPPDGSTTYEIIKTDSYGEYTFVLSDPGQARPGTWALWLVDPSHRRKSDIGGPIVTNNLPADNPSSCWAGGVNFWK